MMERKMRRFKQLLTEDAVKEILNTATNSVLSLIDPEGFPYGVPVSYAYDGDRSIYFHSAARGYKMACIAGDSRASFCVIGQDMIVADEFTSYFRSVIISGKIQIVNDRDERLKGLLLMCDKYSPGVDPDAEIARCIGHVAILRLDIESMSGKEAIELVRSRAAH